MVSPSRMVEMTSDPSLRTAANSFLSAARTFRDLKPWIIMTCTAITAACAVSVILSIFFLTEYNKFKGEMKALEKITRIERGIAGL